MCGTEARGDEPTVPEEYFAGLWCHLSCLNSSEGIEWRKERTRTDPGYARYLRLSTVGLPVVCPSCGGPCLLSAKARGMGAGNWETCCTACDRFTFLSGYERDSDYQRVLAAEGVFLRDGRTDGWIAQIVELARTADRNLRDRSCACGGRFSLAAKPRCPHCKTVLLDSFFHYACAPPP